MNDKQDREAVILSFILSPIQRSAGLKATSLIVIIPALSVSMFVQFFPSKV